MSWKIFLRRLTGISTPLGGVSFQPVTENERKIAFQVISFLEDRRILYRTMGIEVHDWSVKSVFEIRSFLTEMISSTDDYPALTEDLKNIRKACRKFLNDVEADENSEFILDHKVENFKDKQKRFAEAFFDIRKPISRCVMELSYRYDIQIHGELRSILPMEGPNKTNSADAKKRRG